MSQTQLVACVLSDEVLVGDSLHKQDLMWHFGRHLPGSTLVESTSHDSVLLVRNLDLFCVIGVLSDLRLLGLENVDHAIPVGWVNRVGVQVWWATLHV